LIGLDPALHLLPILDLAIHHQGHMVNLGQIGRSPEGGLDRHFVSPRHRTALFGRSDVDAYPFLFCLG